MYQMVGPKISNKLDIYLKVNLKEKKKILNNEES